MFKAFSFGNCEAHKIGMDKCENKSYIRIEPITIGNDEFGYSLCEECYSKSKEKSA